MTARSMPGGLHSRGQALNLDIICFVAVLAQHQGIGWNEGKTLDRTLKRHRFFRRVEFEADQPKGADALRFFVRAVAESVHTHALLAKAPKIAARRSR